MNASPAKGSRALLAPGFTSRIKAPSTATHVKEEPAKVEQVPLEVAKPATKLLKPDVKQRELISCSSSSSSTSRQSL